MKVMTLINPKCLQCSSPLKKKHVGSLQRQVAFFRYSCRAVTFLYTIIINKGPFINYDLGGRQIRLGIIICLGYSRRRVGSLFLDIPVGGVTFLGYCRRGSFIFKALPLGVPFLAYYHG